MSVGSEDDDDDGNYIWLLFSPPPGPMRWLTRCSITKEPLSPLKITRLLYVIS